MGYSGELRDEHARIRMAAWSVTEDSISGNVYSICRRMHVMCFVQTMPGGMDGVLLETGREGCTYHPIYHVWNDEGEYTGECLRKKKGK